jgi:SAM-dependent methyltransferase
MRNPYGRDEVFGVDLAANPSLPADRYRAANLTTQAIPFESSYFNSVSAYDFIEHIPRVISTPDGSTKSPFIVLMSEIWRVLKPGGSFYAVTPAYPRVEAFSDPTHVNIITEETHRYFVEPSRWATMYGFTGSFRQVRVEWIRRNADFEPAAAPLRHKLRRFADGVMGRRSHLLWELEALK